jgi:hypothetical protein
MAKKYGMTSANPSISTSQLGEKYSKRVEEEFPLEKNDIDIPLEINVTNVPLEKEKKVEEEKE